MRMMLEEQVRQGRRCCRLGLCLCRGWVSGVWWGDQWGANQTSFCPGQGVVTVRAWGDESEALTVNTHPW